MAQTRWLLPEYGTEEVARLAAALSIHPLTASVLLHRGFADEDSARRYLRPAVSDLYDPYLLKDMAAAADRLWRAVADREKILLYGDYDVDGTCSVVILKKAIELAGGVASFYVPHRLREGYGMRRDIIEQAAVDGVALIISVDTGIRAVEAVRRARELGIDVIVTDHHLPENQLPPATAILNPNRADCGYPEKNLCGAGVTLKLVQALLARLNWPQERVARVTASFLKLTAIATVADVVPLTGENRIIVKHGLSGLDKVRNPGLRALLDVAGFSGGVAPTAGQIAFRVAPRINAAGRMDDAANVIEMFLTEDVQRARDIAGQLHTLNQDRQQAEHEIFEACMQVPLLGSEMALVYCGQGWHRGVVGIVASRLVEKHCRPVLVLSEDERGEAQGSGRSMYPFHLLNALESMAEMFTRFGGHRHAAGVSLPATRVPELRERLHEYSARHFRPEDFQRTIEIDALVDFRDVNDHTIRELIALGPFGFGNPAPLVAVIGAQLGGVRRDEKSTSVILRHSGKSIVAKTWNGVSELAPGSAVDAAICFEPDQFSRQRGLPGWSAMLKDIRPCIS